METKKSIWESAPEAMLNKQIFAKFFDVRIVGNSYKLTPKYPATIDHNGTRIKINEGVEFDLSGFACDWVIIATIPGMLCRITISYNEYVNVTVNDIEVLINLDPNNNLTIKLK